jgi:hypothetical protein
MCGIGKHHVSQVGGSHAGPYCHSKKIDGLRSLVAKQMRPKDAIRPILDYYLVARIFLCDPARGIPSGSQFFLDPVLEALLGTVRSLNPTEARGGIVKTTVTLAMECLL